MATTRKKRKQEQDEIYAREVGRAIFELEEVQLLVVSMENEIYRLSAAGDKVREQGEPHGGQKAYLANIERLIDQRKALLQKLNRMR